MQKWGQVQDNISELRGCGPLAFSCSKIDRGIFEITEPFEAKLYSYNDIAVRLIMDYGICPIIYTQDLCSKLKMVRM